MAVTSLACLTGNAHCLTALVVEFGDLVALCVGFCVGCWGIVRHDLPLSVSDPHGGGEKGTARRCR